MEFDQVILGNGYVDSTDEHETGRNNNRMIVGPPGSGKTFSYAVPRYLHAQHTSFASMISKRSIYEKCHKSLEDNGYHVLDLNLADPEISKYGFDPMRYVRNADDANWLATTMVQSNPEEGGFSKNEEFWIKGSESLLGSIIGLVHETQNQASLITVLEVLDSLEIYTCGDSIETNLDDAFRKLKRQNPSSYACNCWKTFRSQPPKTAENIYGTLHINLDKVYTPALRKLIQLEEQIDVRSIATELTALFITVSPVNTAMHPYAVLCFSQIMKSLYEYSEMLSEKRLPVPVELIFDDFASACRIPDFSKYISVFREMAISAALLIQSESQLGSLYGERDATTIINCCDTYLYLGGMDLASCRSVSEKLDIPLSDVLWMPVGEEVIFQRGKRPVRTERYPVLEDPEYQRAEAQFQQSLQDPESNKRIHRFMKRMRQTLSTET